MPLKCYKELIVWQKAYQLTLLVYKETEKFPKSEIFGLSSQLRDNPSDRLSLIPIVVPKVAV